MVSETGMSGVWEEILRPRAWRNLDHRDTMRRSLMKLTMYQRVAMIILALFLAAPPSDWMMIGVAIALLGLAFMVPAKEDEEQP